MKKNIFIILGFVSLALGILGSFLPILPTTPLVLLAAYFFSKGSKRWYEWLISLPKFGRMIEEWNDYQIIGTKAKVICFISILSVSIWIGYFSNYHQYVKIIIPVTLIIVLSYVMTRPSSKEKAGKSQLD